jgi:hypothetical protein
MRAAGCKQLVGSRQSPVASTAAGEGIHYRSGNATEKGTRGTRKRPGHEFHPFLSEFVEFVAKEFLFSVCLFLWLI